MLYTLAGIVRIIGLILLFLSLLAFFGAIVGSGWSYLFAGAICLVLSALVGGRSGPL